MKSNNEKLKRIAGAKIFDNLPMDKVEDFKLFYNDVVGEFGEMVKKPMVTEDGRRRVEAVLTIDGREYHGHTVCSKHDNFDKKKGRKIALIRACRAFWENNYVI